VYVRGIQIAAIATVGCDLPLAFFFFFDGDVDGDDEMLEVLLRILRFLSDWSDFGE
jgi:hypothetical protein